MTPTLKDLLPPDQQPLTVQSHEVVLEAINRLRAHDYNQLPVVDDQGRCRGEVVTYDTILQAVLAFESMPSQLRVKDAIKRVQVYNAEDDLLTTLDTIQRNDFALIVGEDEKLTGIVTTADTTAFFHKYAGDLMVIEGVEESVKDAIETLYGGLQSQELTDAIEAVTDRASDTRKKLPSAIKAYLTKMDLATTVGDDSEALTIAESKLNLPKAGKPFDRLTFDEYTEILLRHPNTPKVGDTDGVRAIRKLLNAVRDTRNKLAHFRGDVSIGERENIKFADQWLERHQPARSEVVATIIAAEPVADSAEPAAQLTIDEIIANPSFEVSEAEDSTPKGKYGALSQFLASQPSSAQTCIVSFAEIENLLGGKLPDSAYEYRAWWANDSSKPQAAAWSGEGWRAAAVDMSERSLTFVRTSDRANQFMEFFHQLIMRLKLEDGFPLSNIAPKGANWQALAFLPWSARTQSASIFATFTRDRQLRVELYLDSGNDEQNKKRFDELYIRKGQIESIVGEPLHWERRDRSRACRIALYTKAQIGEASESSSLLDWAAQKVIALHRAFAPEFPAKQYK